MIPEHEPAEDQETMTRSHLAHQEDPNHRESRIVVVEMITMMLIVLDHSEALMRDMILETGATNLTVVMLAARERTTTAMMIAEGEVVLAADPTVEMMATPQIAAPDVTATGKGKGKEIATQIVVATTPIAIGPGTVIGTETGIEIAEIETVIVIVTAEVVARRRVGSVLTMLASFTSKARNITRPWRPYWGRLPKCTWTARVENKRRGRMEKRTI